MLHKKSSAFCLGVALFAGLFGNAAHAQQPIELISFGGGANWPVWTAMDKGLFAKHGVAVKQTFTPNSVFQIENLVAGKFDIATTALDNVVAYQEGQGEVELKTQPDLFAFMGGYAGGLRLDVSPDIKTFTDIKGKAIGVDAATTGFAFILYKMLAMKGVKMEDYQIEKLGGTPNRVKALMEGKIVATMVSSPSEVLPESKGFKRLADTTKTFGAYQTSVGAARRAWAKDNKARLVGFIRAYVEAIDWLYKPENKAEALEIYMKHLKDTPKEAAEQSYKVMFSGKEGFQKKAKIDLKGARTVLKLRSEYAKPKKDLKDPKKYIDESYYREAVKTASSKKK
jgi:ABC-type nitrate/sulfonate/bicarbonate transport system substrate-binding protein